MCVCVCVCIVTSPIAPYVSNRHLIHKIMDSYSLDIKLILTDICIFMNPIVNSGHGYLQRGCPISSSLMLKDKLQFLSLLRFIFMIKNEKTLSILQMRPILKLPLIL